MIFKADMVYRYGWRYQIGPWVRRGYRVVVPDMLGYGGTQKPIEASEYTPKKLCADLAALLDLLEIKKAVCYSEIKRLTDRFHVLIIYNSIR